MAIIPSTFFKDCYIDQNPVINVNILEYLKEVMEMFGGVEVLGLKVVAKQQESRSGQRGGYIVVI